MSGSVYSTMGLYSNATTVLRRAHSPVWIILMLAVAASLRLLHLENAQTSPAFWALSVDPLWYDTAARRIASGEWGPFPLFRAPLYPMLLGGVYSIFGHDLVTARMVNTVLQLITIWAVCRVGRRYFSTAVGYLAALLLTVNGTAIYFSAEVLSVSLEMLLATLALWSTLYAYRRPGLWSTVVCGLTWGLAAITRPNFLPLFIIPLIAVWLANRRRIAFPRSVVDSAPSSPRNRSLPHALLFLIAGLLPIAPVTRANVSQGGEFVLIATQGGVNFWIGNNPEARGVQSSLPGYGSFWTLDDARAGAAIESGRDLPPGEQSAFYYRKGLNFLISNPVHGLRLMVRKAGLFFNRHEISNNKHIGFFAAKSPWLPSLMLLNLGLLLPLAGLGAWGLRNRGHGRILIGLILAYALTVILFFVTSRFRLPVVPPLSLLAAAGAVWIGSVVGNRFLGRSLWPAVLLLPGAVVAWMNPWGLSESNTGAAHYMEGNAYLSLGQSDHAVSSFRNALGDSTVADMAHLNLGVIAYGRQDLITARDHYQAAIDLNRNNHLAWNNLAIIHELNGDTLRALTGYQKALELRPHAEDPRHNLSGLYLKLGIEAIRRDNPEQARACLNESIHQWPTAAAHYSLALLLARAGRPTEAILELDRALTIDPHHSRANELRRRIMDRPSESPADAEAPANADPTP